MFWGFGVMHVCSAVMLRCDQRTRCFKCQRWWAEGHRRSSWNVTVLFIIKHIKHSGSMQVGLVALMLKSFSHFWLRKRGNQSTKLVLVLDRRPVTQLATLFGWSVALGSPDNLISRAAPNSAKTRTWNWGEEEQRGGATYCTPWPRLCTTPPPRSPPAGSWGSHCRPYLGCFGRSEALGRRWGPWSETLGGQCHSGALLLGMCLSLCPWPVVASLADTVRPQVDWLKRGKRERQRKGKQGKKSDQHTHTEFFPFFGYKFMRQLLFQGQGKKNNSCINRYQIGVLHKVTAQRNHCLEKGYKICKSNFVEKKEATTRKRYKRQTGTN